MRNRSCCNRAQHRPPTDRRRPNLFLYVAACFLALTGQASARNEAPQWMHAIANAPLLPYDEKTDAVLLFSETNVTVLSAEKIRTQVRKAYKILRPNGRERGTLVVYFNSPAQNVTSLHGWCIPAQGKDFEVKEEDAIDASPPNVPGGELVSDVRAKILRIPAPDPGNIVGYEYEIEERPLVLQNIWYFQGADPVRESRYTLQLPSNWEYKASFLKYSDVKPTQAWPNQWQWVLGDVKGIREEPDMPPYGGVVGRMVVSFFPAAGISPTNGYADGNGMGDWYWNLTKGRMDASTELKQEVDA